MATARTLSFGMTGTDVRNLQAALNYHLRPPNPPHTPPGNPRPPLATDGVFGPLTDARIKEFQRLNDLVDDGIVGHLTRPLLTSTRSVLVRWPRVRMPRSFRMPLVPGSIQK